MKKVYETPDFELLSFQTQDILAASGENPLISKDDQVGTAVEFGPITIF